MSEEPHTYDLVVIGAGMAGAAAAKKCAAGGWAVAIVDDLPYGGTCALRGCDPKKILRRGAEVIDAAELLAGKGIDPGGMRIDWPALSTHMHGFTDPVAAAMENDLARHGVDTLHGLATFTDVDRLQIDGTSHHFRHALIATGAVPRQLDFPGTQHLTDSTGFLYLDRLPRRVLFVGGGFVSFEFAHLAARAGSEMVIVDHRAVPLSGFDPDLVELLVASGEAAGIHVHRQTEVASIRPSGDRFEVTLERNAERSTVQTDLVVHGAGRRPALGRLNLDSAGIAYTSKGVTVTGDLKSTTNARIYAAGDAAASPGAPLTPVAVFEGKVAASNMLNSRTTVPDYHGIATAVFTIPELARVGLLEAEALEAGRDIDIRYTDTSRWYSNYRTGESTAAVKILVDNTSDTIVGAHMLGPGYSELINYCALAIKLGLTTRQLKSMTPAYPTVTSDLGSML